MGVKINLIGAYVKHTVEEKLGLEERRERERLKKTTAYCKNKDEFKQAIKEERNKIIVLDDGKIDAIGTHDELKVNNAIYREVYESQVKGADDNE